MQFWTQRMSDKTNKEVANLRKEMDEKLEKILKEMKNNRRTQSVPNRRYREQNTPRAGTSKYTSNEDGEENASEPENQECEIQDNTFRPSNLNELRTPLQPLSIQNIHLNDSVVINEDRTKEDYHSKVRTIRGSLQARDTMALWLSRLHLKPFEVFERHIDTEELSKNYSILLTVVFLFHNITHSIL